MRSVRLAGLAFAASCGLLAGGSAGQAMDVPLKWSTGWSDNEFVINGQLSDDDSQIDDFGFFLARCEPGKSGTHLWFFVDRARFPGQAVSSDGMRSPYRQRSAAVIVDGTSYDLKGATLAPEEASGGHELTLDTGSEVPLLKVLRNGHSMAVKIDDITLPSFSLVGASGSFDIFARTCAGPARSR